MNLQNIEQARYHMIEQQIRPWNLADVAVLHLMSDVKREDFVPAAYKAMAFADMEIPLGSGQCMLSPKVQARLLQDAAVKPGDKVLEIGTGSGFMTAMLARLALRVISLEIDPEIANKARANLQQAGVHNFEVRQADGSQGVGSDAPFDVILLSGSVPQAPQVLLDQLKVGGRLVAIIGNDPIMSASVVTRTGQAQYKTVTLWETVAPVLSNFAQTSTFAF